MPITNVKMLRERRRANKRAASLLIVLSTFFLLGAGYLQLENPGGLVYSTNNLSSISPSVEGPTRPSTKTLSSYTSAYMQESTPTGIRIPSLDINEPRMTQLNMINGLMQTPNEAYLAGWYTGSPTPGELGPAVIAAHYDWYDGGALFYDLDKIKIDDRIYIAREDGSEAEFVVSKIKHYEQSDPAALEAYENIDHAGLRLITCAGEFDQESSSYSDNLIVYARLVGDDQ